MSAEDSQARATSPSADQVTSAAAAMLKLSSSLPQSKAPVYAVPDPSVTSPSSIGSLSPGRNCAAGQHSPGGADYNPVGGHRPSRKQREFIPEYRKDDHYWVKRRKNNEAAKRSREKRRTNDMVMGDTIMDLNKENQKLRRELDAIKRQFGLPTDQRFPFDEEELGEQSQHSSGTDNTCPSVGSLDPDQQMTGEPPVQMPPKMPPLSPIHTLGRGAVVAQPVSAPRLITPGGTAGLIPDPQSQQQLSHGAPTSTTHRHLASTSNLCPVLPQGGQIPPRIAAPGFMGYHHLPHHHTATSHPGRAVPHARPPHRAPSPDMDSNDSSHSLKISFSAAGSTSSDTSDNEKGVKGKVNNGRGGGGAAVSASQAAGAPTIQQQRSRSMARKGMPVKLRHKVFGGEQHDAQEEWNCDTHAQQDPHLPGGADPNGAGHDDACGEYSAFLQRGSSNTSSDEANSNSGGKPLDPKYVERRRRNNMAARRCRENRRVLTDMRIAKANILESENTHLKEELHALNTEIGTLKDMLDKKRVALAKGEAFELPPLEVLKEERSRKSKGGSTRDPASSGS